MGADTKGFVKSNVGVNDIVRILEKKLVIGNVSVDETRSAYWLGFTTRSGEKRNMMVILNYVERYTNGEAVTFFDLSRNEEAQMIMKTLVESFGGYYLSDDCADDEEWQYIPSNGEGFELTEQDVLERKVYDKILESNLSYNERNHLVKFITNNLDWVKSL